MDTKYRKRYLRIRDEDWSFLEPILDWYYTHSDWDELAVEHESGEFGTVVGIRCDSDDFEEILQKLRNSDIPFR